MTHVPRYVCPWAVYWEGSHTFISHVNGGGTLEPLLFGTSSWVECQNSLKLDHKRKLMARWRIFLCNFIQSFSVVYRASLLGVIILLIGIMWVPITQAAGWATDEGNSSLVIASYKQHFLPSLIYVSFLTHYFLEGCQAGLTGSGFRSPEMTSGWWRVVVDWKTSPSYPGYSWAHSDRGFNPGFGLRGFAAWLSVVYQTAKSRTSARFVLERSSCSIIVRWLALADGSPTGWRYITEHFEQTDLRYGC